MDHVQAKVSRRTVLRYGIGGLAAVGGGTSLVLLPTERASADLVETSLHVLAGERTMVDGLVVPFVGFGSTSARLELPSGQLEVQAGDQVMIHLTNAWTSPVGFSVPASRSYAGYTSEPVGPGQKRAVSFTAPTTPGTYYYVGTLNGSADTGRALGATGALVVLPREPSRTSVDTLYPGVRERGRRQPSMGTGPAPAMPATIRQERTWLFSETNPSTARTLAGGRVSLPSDPEPEYFLINGLGGMLSAEDHQTNITGRAGGMTTPGTTTLVRMINTGRAPRSIHLHGSHFWVLSHPDTPWLVGAHKDTVRVPSGQTVDIFIPMDAPSDSYPPVNRAQKYVVHDHIEMAETASGGHYPSGMISELIFE